MLPRVSSLTPTRCYPVALGHKPRESSSNLGPMGQISYFNCLERKVRGSAVRAPDLGPTSENCQCASQGVPLMSTRCNPVALGLKPRESVSNLEPPGRISCFISNRNQSSGVRRSSPTSAQLAGSAKVLPRESPPTPTRCNPVALGLIPENPCQSWNPRAKFRVLYRIETKVLGSAVRVLDLGPTSGKCRCAPQGVPSNTY